MIERSNIQKEKAIKILIRKILEVYFENLLTFFKMCSFIEPKSKNRIIHKRSPKVIF